MIAWIIAFAVLSWLLPASGQQYAGSPVNVTLTAISGSEITFFNIRTPSGTPASLINYFSLPTSTGKRPDPAKIQRLLVVLHGSNRNAWDYFSIFNGGVPPATVINSNVTQETVAVLTPWFANTDDSAKFKNGSGNALIWSGTGWSGGDDSALPDGSSVSSFDCLDQILEYFDNKALYPNLHQIVVAGHSRGAQMAQRYAAVGRPLQLNTPVTYWIGNANALLWLNSSRPLDTSDCLIYDDWREGLSNYTNVYENRVVNTPGAIRARYASRDLAYARGLNDHGDESDDCKPYSQGPDRGERLYGFLTFFPPDAGDTVDYVTGVGHNSIKMVADESGVYRLYLDNFDGQGHRHADFGPRQVAGDNPHPDST